MYFDNIQARLASHKGMISLRELQSQSQEELDALLSCVLRMGKYKCLNLDL